MNIYMERKNSLFEWRSEQVQKLQNLINFFVDRESVIWYYD